jgi:shikimate dehydrogenase
MELSGKTKICGVIGDPIDHSLSPVMHNAAFNSLKLDFVFVAFRVKKSELESAIGGMRSLDIHGLNVTMPHKSAVIKYLDEIDSTANFIGAVNTILNNNGSLMGYATDGVGALKALEENGVNLAGKKLLLLGAGGAAKAIAFSTAKEAEELVILNRTVDNAKKLAEVLCRKLGKKTVGKALSPALIRENLQDADVLINATPVGMHPNIDRSLVDPKWMRPGLSVMDIVYNPVETKLIKDAKAAGAKVISGVEMLIYQGAASFEIWTGHQAPIKVMKEAILNKLSETGATH